MFEQRQILTCTLSTTNQSDLCPAGYALTVEPAFIATRDEMLPADVDFAAGAFGFAFVITAYLLGVGLGLLFRVFRSE